MSSGDKKSAAEKVMQLDAMRHSPLPPAGDDGPHSPLSSIGRSLTPRPNQLQQPQTAREKSGTFQNLNAYTEAPQRRNQKARTEVLGPPRSAAKDQPSRLDKKWGLVGDMPFQDLLWICEQSFRKEATSLGKEILAIARTEFTNVTDTLLHDIRQPVETLADEIVPKIVKTLQEVEAPAKVDWEPANKEFRGQGERLDSLERSFTEEISLLRSEIHELQQQHKESSGSLGSQMDDVKGNILMLHDELVKSSDRQAMQVCNAQQSLSAESLLISGRVKELQQEMRATHDELFPRMGDQLKKYVKDEPVNVDFEQILDQFGSTTQVMLRNQADLLENLTIIKNELHQEFTSKLEEQQRIVHVRLEEIADATNQASDNRMRDSWAQTDPPPVTERSAQTDFKVLINNKRAGDRGSTNPDGTKRDTLTDAEKREKEKEKKKVFANEEAMRRRARQALMQPKYDVTNFYKDSGCTQALAKHWAFEYFTFFVITVNAIWIAIDIDNNDASVLVHAEPVFQVVENVFCTYFTMELTVRFLAFKQKRNCLRDLWFVFDLLLVASMIVETWVITIVFLAAGLESSPNVGQLSGLRMFRMVKMVRLSRMAKLLRAIPELVVLLKAIGAALRSMAVFFLLWLIVIYIFAVIFRQLTEGSILEESLFQSVPNAMNTLLMKGIMPENELIVNSVTNEHLLYWPLMMGFILLTSVTLMYMLIGVLTDVIQRVSMTEKEGLLVTMVASRLRQALIAMGRQTDDALSKMDFQEVLVQPEVASLCQDCGVNVVVLVDMSDVIFENIDKEGKGMTFENLVEVILNMRGTNPATVKDIKETLRVIKGLVNDCHSGMMHKFTRSFDGITKDIKAIRRMVDGADSG